MFIECNGRGTCSFFTNNIDFWLARNPVSFNFYGKSLLLSDFPEDGIFCRYFVDILFLAAERSKETYNFVPTFKPFLVGNTIYFSFKINLYFLQDLTQPGMWGMGNVYNGIDDVIDRGKHKFLVFYGCCFKFYFVDRVID